MSNLQKKLGAAATAPEASKINTLPEHADQKNRPPIEFKQCGSCHERKPASKFARNTFTADGYLNKCFACSRAKKRPLQSLRKAINNKCRECLYDPISGNGNWRQQVTLCTSGNCPLFDVRPTSKGLHDG